MLNSEITVVWRRGWETIGWSTCSRFIKSGPEFDGKRGISFNGIFTEIVTNKLTNSAVRKYATG